MVVAVDIIVTGNITDSSLNPARTFGPYLGDTLFGGPNLWNFFPIHKAEDLREMVDYGI